MAGNINELVGMPVANRPRNCGYSIEEGDAILSDLRHLLSQSNIVSIDIGWKVVSLIQKINILTKLLCTD